jgi:hypothetical protein
MTGSGEDIWRMNESEKKELPLSALKLSFSFETATAPVFFDIHKVAVAVMTRRARSLADIERELEEAHQAGREVYLYKLYEQMVDYPGGPTARELTYTLRYLIQARRGPDGKFVTGI